MTLQVDYHEPPTIKELLGQVDIPVEVTGLNDKGFADFRWDCAPESEEKPKHAERKTWHDLLRDLSSIENQLLRQMQAHMDHDLLLIVEGLVVPTTGLLSGAAVLRQTKQGKLWSIAREYKMSLQACYAWLYRTSRYIPIYMTSDVLNTARALVAFYKSDQKGVHYTFRRHTKEIEFHPNPQVTGLMGMIPGLGPIKAESLIGRFGTIWQVLCAMPEDLAEVPGVGINEATKWLQLIGRTDV